MSILDEIIRRKKTETRDCRKAVPVSTLESDPLFARECNSLLKKMDGGREKGIIAEFKRRSPSKGVINDKLTVQQVALAYEKSGALAMSVLTDEHYFGGTLADLRQARNTTVLPLLRKDFIVDEYQVLEAKANGADLVLIIAAVLNKYEISHLAALARSLGMEVLFEIHEEEELDKLCADIQFVGVNNRDLRSFDIKTETSLKLAEKIPPEFLKVSESGLSSADTIRTLMGAGFSAFLIGEYFMQTGDPGLACGNLVKEIRR
jgi:indole-3-glycerol phosphate synthase